MTVNVIEVLSLINVGPKCNKIPNSSTVKPTYKDLKFKNLSG